MSKFFLASALLVAATKLQAQTPAPQVFGPDHTTDVYRNDSPHGGFKTFRKSGDDNSTIATWLQGAGYRTELTFPHWLGKAWQHDDFVDLVFSSGNGICQVDDGWFDNAVETQVLAIPTGEQDYHPALHGGVLALHYTVQGTRIERLAVDLATLRRHILLIYSGVSRNSCG